MQNKVFSCAHSEVPPPDPFTPPTFSPFSIWGETLTWAGLSSFAMSQQWFLTLAAYRAPGEYPGEFVKMQIPGPHPSDS